MSFNAMSVDEAKVPGFMLAGNKSIGIFNSVMLAEEEALNVPLTENNPVGGDEFGQPFCIRNPNNPAK